MQVPVHIAFHGLDKSEAVEARIREKVGKLERYFERITSCRVVVEKHHASHSNLNTNGQPFHVSIVVDVPGAELVVRRDPKDTVALKNHEDINIAVRAAFASMERQLKEYVSRRWRDVRTQAERALDLPQE